ncbi:hypothetical protein KL86DES1_22087 [uncultured Desulfovibrio sp.]|uniref:Uncharacterized protein n=1 Tax=uncultured Desulfovibrio sp. TaxID=167968 RepID=A0A212LAZ8_9BACT|nr:hypothetical protein KL86DES1_22087 [uncultured Desulfovibrio sp.]VZH34981.1 conserved protein of unknown function [Desulfovibrio sp. 86]
MKCPDLLGTPPRDQSPMARMIRAMGDWRFCPGGNGISEGFVGKRALWGRGFQASHS